MRLQDEVATEKIPSTKGKEQDAPAKN